MKFLFWICGSLLAAVVAICPEVVMYFAYHLIAPQSDLARCLILGVFWLAGSGLCVATAFLGIYIFGAVTALVLE